MAVVYNSSSFKRVTASSGFRFSEISASQTLVAASTMFASGIASSQALTRLGRVSAFNCNPSPVSGKLRLSGINYLQNYRLGTVASKLAPGKAIKNMLNRHASQLAVFCIILLEDQSIDAKWQLFTQYATELTLGRHLPHRRGAKELRFCAGSHKSKSGRDFHEAFHFGNVFHARGRSLRRRFF